MKKSRLILITLSVLILLGCISMTAFLLFFNYQNVRLFKQAQSNFLRNDEASLALAEAQLLQIIAKDSDNEAAFVMLGEIARKKKIYPEQVYYCFMAYHLNPLSGENKEKYIESLCFARYFKRLETILSQEPPVSDRHNQLLLYAAGRNGNINKYKIQLARRSKDNRLGELALLLFAHEHLTNAQKLSALERFKYSDDLFLQQEILTAQTDLFIAEQNIDKAEKSLTQAYELNQYAFAPALGRFYANYRNLGRALEVFEKHLSIYHDQSVAIQTAEICCLLNKIDRSEKLRTDYQSDSGNRAMLCNYYFDALIALAKKEMTGLKELSVPLRQNINTPLSAFMFFCTDIQAGDLTAIQNSYNTLIAHRNYLDLQIQADNILSEYLKNAVSKNTRPQNDFMPLAALLYKRKPDVFTAKLMLLVQKQTNAINAVLLKDALKRFGDDPGIIKIAIEYNLKHELSEAERLITSFKTKFAKKSGDMLRYEIILNLQKKDFNKVSALFRKHFSPEILPEYWIFASSTGREHDLRFLSRDKLYEPFCKALILLKNGKVTQACELLEKADANNNQQLLFFAAKTLAENGKNQSAIKKYALLPQNSPYQLAVLLNTAELHAEAGNMEQALILSARAYNMAPDMPETQLCYADKLHRNGKLRMIPDILKYSSAKNYRKKMEPLWIAGIQQRIKDCDISTQREKIRELCRQLLVIDPGNKTALDYLKKLHKMPQ